MVDVGRGIGRRRRPVRAGMRKARLGSTFCADSWDAGTFADGQGLGEERTCCLRVRVACQKDTVANRRMRVRP